MSGSREKMTRSAIILALFAIIGTGLLSFTYNATIDKINQNERNEILYSLHNIIPPDLHDNDIFNDTIRVTNPELLGSSEAVNVYLARKNGKPVAAVFSSIAPNGYNGAIHLLIGIDMNGVLTGVRVIKHHETPGLGDVIEEQRSDWILSFTGKSLLQPEQKRWKVKKDGGYYDQFTGATITPRAIVKAIHHTLLYFQANSHTLFTRKENKPVDE